MNISIVIPLYNEEESLPELHDWIKKVMDANGYSYEILFVDDGSKDKSWQVIEGLATKNPNVKALQFRRNYGKSPGLYVGFEAAQPAGSGCLLAPETAASLLLLQLPLH